MVTIKFNFVSTRHVRLKVSFFFRIRNNERKEEAILVFSLESEIRHDMSKLEIGKGVNVELLDDELHRY